MSLFRYESASRRMFLQAIAAGMCVSQTRHVHASPIAQPGASAEVPLYYRSARQLRDLIRSGYVSPVEVVEAYLERIERLEPHINAVNHLPQETAKNEAKAAEQSIRNGVDWRDKPLLGVPVSIKDMYQVAGMPTTAGARMRKNNVASENATAVQRLKDAGAIVIAITNTPLNHSAIETANKLHGTTRNPYDLERTPGGSSGGEAALIAAGGSPCGLGGDAGGSIRVPSHFCGIAGLAPAWGRVSTAGIVPLLYNSGPFYLRCGPMARYVEDLALLLPIISGLDSRDPFTFPMTLGNHNHVEIDKLRVAYCVDAKKIKPADSIQQTLEVAAKVLKGRVKKVEKEIPPNYDSDDPFKFEASFTLLGSIGAQREELKKLGEEDDELRQEIIRLANEWLNKQDLGELEQRAAKLPEIRLEMNQFFERYDVLLCPVAADLAYKHGKSWERVFQTGMFLVNQFNLCGNLPAGVVRCGTSPDGLPIGVQVVAKSYREDIVLAVMELLEKALGGWKPPPEGNFDN